ncbi:hypothetical protein IWW48_005603 [Coemansia sp. RSA 1200]|nr:hypothetical protein IWW48_005603 [Coemansia sp. RSA 1200]
MRGSAAVTTHCISREVFAEHGLHKLLPSVSAGSATRDTNIESSIFIKEYPYLMSEASLTSLFCRYPIMGKMAVDVIIRNAPVLVTLVLDSFHLPQLKDIMLDKENNPIVYSRLKDFEYRVGSIFGLGKREKIMNGTPFPVLERAKCQKIYIFNDDALFRGCGETLKHLDMQSTRSLVLWDFVDDYSIAETIAQYPNVQNLIHLNLGNVKLQFTETAEMIQVLPNIEYFSYTCNRLGSTFRRVDHNEKPRLVLKQYYPLSLRLKYCNINTTDYTSPISLAITTLLLAIACPKLTFAKVPGKILDAYNNMIENDIGAVSPPHLVRFSENIPEALPPAPLAEAATHRVNGCFVFVTRSASLTKVRRTMFDVEKRFNERHAYPYVFLSEHPFTAAFKRIVRKATNASVHFGLIDQHQWQYPQWIDQDRAKSAVQMWADANGASVAAATGWRHMVRFWAAPVALHPLLRSFRYMWRLEPGSHYTCDIAYDPLRLMHDRQILYAFAVSFEAMPDTVPTLWSSALEFIHDSLSAHALPSNNKNNSLGWILNHSSSSRKSRSPHSYNRCEFLTNFELVDLDFMRSDAYQQLFDFLDRRGGIYYERWTDASIRSLAVAMLLGSDKAHWLHDIGYRHDLRYNCPAARDLQMRSTVMMPAIMSYMVGCMMGYKVF